MEIANDDPAGCSRSVRCSGPIEGLSESLRRELMLFGIDVIVVAPGAVKTPIWSKAEEVDISAYQNSPFFPGLERIATPGIRGRPDRPTARLASGIRLWAKGLTAASVALF